jgi:hypothetical protein
MKFLIKANYARHTTNNETGIELFYNVSRGTSHTEQCRGCACAMCSTGDGRVSVDDILISLAQFHCEAPQPCGADATGPARTRRTALST